MIRRLFLLFAICLGVHAIPSFAADASDNSDAGKYEFARSYITALGYMKDMDDRWTKNAPKKLYANQKNKMILATINDLALDSSDLLIMKNYLLKYMLAKNRLMRRTANITVIALNRDIEINHEEKTLWEKWYDLSAANQATRPKEIDFVQTQYNLELQRKEAEKDIVQASILMTHVLISNQNKDGKGHLLAVTAQQRQKLLDKLDSFGQDTLDWGLKTGQTTLEASIAAIREVLEDSLWTSIDEK